LVLDLDASYMRSYSPNVYPNPTDLLGWTYMQAGASCTLSRDTTMTRQYGSIPMKMTITGNDPYTSHNSGVYNLAPAANGQTWTVSVWAKASVPTDGQIFIFGTDANGSIFVINDYSGGGTFNITTSWQRFSLTYTFTKAATNFIQIRLDGTNSGGSGINIWWDGLQVERASTATRFNPYYFGNTTWRNSLGTGFNATLVNAPIFTSNNLSFFTCDSSQNFTVSNPLNQSNLTQEWSVCAWVNIDTVTGAGARYLISGLNSGVAVEWFDSGTLLYLNGGADDYYTYGNSIEGSGWIMLSFLFKNSGAYRKIFSNTTDITTSGPNNTSTPSGQSGTFTIANNMRGKISSLMIYNRLLSTTEISANYEAMKTRFGL
jgi:hypothetical protein